MPLVHMLNAVVFLLNNFSGFSQGLGARLPTPALTPSALGGESPFMTWGEIEGMCQSV